MSASLTPVECRQMRQAFVGMEPGMLLGAEVVAAVLGLTNTQLRQRMRDGDLYDLVPVRDAVRILGRQVREALKLHKFSTTASINSAKVL